MRIRILGSGWYGSHLAVCLLEDGHDVELHEISDHLFAGASGGNPARLHLGLHYPRSRLTRAACLENMALFMKRYGHLTRSVRTNLYAIAAFDSMLDFAGYRQILSSELEVITVHDPADYGLQNVEGALLCNERHIVIAEARKHFTEVLGDRVKLSQPAGDVDDPHWDVTIDCTFCALDSESIDRYEPCVVGILEGPCDTAVTIMDGPFPSVYPWSPSVKLSSISSAKLTPLTKQCYTYQHAKDILDNLGAREARSRVEQMVEQMANFWPEVRDRYAIAGEKLSIRAMPRSAADARLVDVVRIGQRGLRCRAGKIDMIGVAYEQIRSMLPC